jgi:hypothetical protein
MREIRFEDFHNDTPKPLARVDVARTGYSNSTGYKDERGSIDGLRFINATSSGGGIYLSGAYAKHAVRNVQLSGCRVGGRLLMDKRDLTLGKHVYGVRFTSTPDEGPELSFGAEADVATTNPPEVLLDNGDEGTWAFGGKGLSIVDAERSHGGSTWRLQTLGPGHAAVYEPRLSGRYEVAIYVPVVDDAKGVAPWTVRHTKGYSTHLIDEGEAPGWRVVGVYDLAGDSWVRLIDPHHRVSQGSVAADAVRFRRVEVK